MPYFNLFNQSLTGKPIPVLQPEVLAPQCPHLLQQFLRRRRADRRLHGRRRRRGYGGSGRRLRAAPLEELLVVLPDEGALVAGAEQRLGPNSIELLKIFFNILLKTLLKKISQY